jgi:hypothetical protein
VLLHQPTHLKIQKKAKDICGECYVCANRICRCQGKKRHEESSLDDSDTSDREEEDMFVVLPLDLANRKEGSTDAQAQMIASKKLVEQARSAGKSTTGALQREEERGPPNRSPSNGTTYYLLGS